MIWTYKILYIDNRHNISQCIIHTTYDVMHKET